MLDKLLKGAKGEEDCAPEEMKGNPKIKAKRELLQGLQKMAMRMMNEQGDKPDAVEASVTLAKPEMADKLAMHKMPSVMGLEPSDDLDDEDQLEHAMEQDSDEENEALMAKQDESPEALKAKIKELEAKLAAKA